MELITVAAIVACFDAWVTISAAGSGEWGDGTRQTGELMASMEAAEAAGVVLLLGRRPTRTAGVMALRRAAPPGWGGAV